MINSYITHVTLATINQLSLYIKEKTGDHIAFYSDIPMTIKTKQMKRQTCFLISPKQIGRIIIYKV